MVFSSKENRFEKNTLFLFALIAFILLFLFNGHIWLYLYFILWFSIISLIHLFFYVKIKHVSVEIDDEIKNLVPIFFLMMINLFIFLFTISVGAMAKEKWFISEWNQFKMIILYVSYFLFFIVFFCLLKYEFSKEKYKVEQYLFSKKFGKIYKLISKINSIKLPSKSKKIILSTMKLISIIFVIIFLFFQTLFFYPYVINPVMDIRAESNIDELQNIVNDITINKETDYEKAKSVFDWFNYKSGEMYNIWGHPLLTGPSVLLNDESKARLVFGYYNPFNCILCMRTYGRNAPLWILTSRCGACEEYALLYREMVHAAGIPVRSIHCYEGNHCWDEVFINGSWIIVDSSRQLFDEPYLNYTTEFKNPRYVFAELPEGKEIIDRTANYSNLSYVNITTVDTNNKIVPYVTIEIFSKNDNSSKERTELIFTTDENGKYQLEIGAGTTILESNDKFKSLYNSTTQNFTEHKHYNLTIVLEHKVQESGFPMFIFPLTGVLYFVLFFILFKFRRKRKMIKGEIEDNSYFVSFIDVLGFKKLVRDNDKIPDLLKVHRSIYRTLWGIKEAHRTGKSNEFITFLQPLTVKILYIDEILTNNIYNFSDSIILYIESSNDANDNIKRLNALCWITNVLIAKSILVGDKTVFELPLRAAISYGPLVVDTKNKIHVGKPLIDAYELSNALNWMGGAIHPSVPEKYVQSLVGYNNEIYEYNIPVKNKYIRKMSFSRNDIKYALNWVRQHPSHEDYFPIMNGRKPRPLIEDIGKNHVKRHNWGVKRKNLKKRNTTMKFIKRICDEFDMMEELVDSNKNH